MRKTCLWTNRRTADLHWAKTFQFGFDNWAGSRYHRLFRGVDGSNHVFPSVAGRRKHLESEKFFISPRGMMVSQPLGVRNVAPQNLAKAILQ